MAKLTDLYINNFYEKAMQNDFARDINFRITQIESGFSNLTFDPKKDLIYAKSGKVPGRNITNVEAKYMGLTFNIPGVVSYPNSESYSLKFYCDKNSYLRNKFEIWSRNLFNDANSTGDYRVPQKTSYIQLAQLSPDQSILQQYKLVGASVRSIGDLEYDFAEGTGSVMSFEATVSYHYYELLDANGTTVNNYNTLDKSLEDYTPSRVTAAT